MLSSDRFRFRPQLEGFEDRSVPAVLTNPATVMALTAPAATDYNQRIIDYCKTHVGVQVGGGECAHLATEALRVAGADFAVNNYVWGSAVTTITKGRDSNPKAVCRPGDIIQFEGVSLKWSEKIGSTHSGTYGHHTAVVAAVDSQGRPTKVYEENVGVDGKGKGAGAHDRHERLDTYPINMNTVTAGTITVYRAVSRVDKPGQYQFTLNNSTNAQVTAQIRSGTSNIGQSFVLSKNNTPQEGNNPVPCYVTQRASSSNGSALSLNVVVNGKPLSLVGGGTIQNGSGYEIASVGGQLVLRRV